MIVSFVVNQVHGKCRPKFTRKVIAYKDKSDRDYEKLVAAEYMKQSGHNFGDAPISMRIVIHRPLPKSKKKSIKLEHDTVKPDVDNIFKAISDALNGIAYDDDKQICEAYIIKLPRTREAEEHVTITIQEMEELCDYIS